MTLHVDRTSSSVTATGEKVRRKQRESARQRGHTRPDRVRPKGKGTSNYQLDRLRSLLGPTISICLH
ncbi:hypothetical protein GE21DRAFT_1279981 [Neurospora crassa]|nr:hypothetical protein GE21DRAFT_1279981 [Neurospora crassa]